MTAVVCTLTSPMPYLEFHVQAVPLIKVTDMTEIGQHTSHLLRLSDEERTRMLDGLHGGFPLSPLPTWFRSWSRP